jgi:mono/diheme cytochrome c family protein
MLGVKMKKYIPVFFALFVILGLLALPLSAADAVAGKEIYLKKCKSCHAEDGAGTPAMLKKFGDKLKPLGSAEIQKMKDPEMIAGFKAAENHKALVKTTTDADLANIVAHIRTLKK